MSRLPATVTFELEGWSLFWADLGLTGEGEAELAALREETSARVRSEREISKLAQDPTVQALRRLFKASGTDPSRYRPSSEALLRRLLKGGEMPAISPFVDLGNCLSARLAVPCCVMAEGTTGPPFSMRPGLPEEQYDSLKGPFKLAGRPLLVDAAGPCDTPITGNQRVKVRAETQRCDLVAYLPRDLDLGASATDVLRVLLDRAPVARLEDLEIF